MSTQAKQQVVALVEPLLAAEGFELADMALSLYRTKTLLRLFVYAQGGGPTLDQCAFLSRRIGEVVDAADLFPRGYTLEVSSPGLDRPLTTARDFKYRTDEEVAVDFVDQSRPRLVGRIVGIDGDLVRLATAESEMLIPLAEISRARIVF